MPPPRTSDHTIVPGTRQPETSRPAAVDETAIRPAAQVRAPVEDTAIRPAVQVAPETASPPQTVEPAAVISPLIEDTAQKQKGKSQAPTVKTVPPVATRVAMRQPQQQTTPLPIVGGAIAAALIVVVAVFAFLHFRPTTHHTVVGNPTIGPTATVSAPTAVPTTTAAALQIAAVRPKHGKTFASGSKISLRWTKVKGAVYHLEITTDPARTVAQSFRHPLTSIQTKKSGYSFKVEGKRTYLSRVQAKIGGKWGPFSKVQKFPVAAPKIGKALLKSPPSGKTHNTKHGVAMGLCWYKVPGANNYLLSVSGHRTLRSTAPATRYVSAEARRISLACGCAGARRPSVHGPNFTRSGIQHPHAEAQPTAMATTVVQATPTPQPAQATSTPQPVQQATATPIPVQQPTATPIPVQQPTAVQQPTKCDPSYQVC